MASHYKLDSGHREKLAHALMDAVRSGASRSDDVVEVARQSLARCDVPTLRALARAHDFASYAKSGLNRLRDAGRLSSETSGQWLLWSEKVPA